MLSLLGVEGRQIDTKTPGACCLVSQFSLICKPQVPDTVSKSKEARMAPEEQSQRLTSGLHVHTHVCAPAHINIIKKQANR